MVLASLIEDSIPIQDKIQELLRRVLFLSHEWGPTAVVGSFDVATAFDSMDHDFMFEAMLGVGIPEHIVAALMRELLHVQADAEIKDITSVEAIGINKGGRQGGTETPNEWNWLMEYILRD
eukprot:11974497-Karenia_brevis.AAC.1